MIAGHVHDQLLDAGPVLRLEGVHEADAVHLDRPAERRRPRRRRRRRANIGQGATDALGRRCLQRFLQPGGQIAAQLVQPRHRHESAVGVAPGERRQLQPRVAQLLEGGAGRGLHPGRILRRRERPGQRPPDFHRRLVRPSRHDAADHDQLAGGQHRLDIDGPSRTIQTRFGAIMAIAAFHACDDEQYTGAPAGSGGWSAASRLPPRDPAVGLEHLALLSPSVSSPRPTADRRGSRTACRGRAGRFASRRAVPGRGRCGSGDGSAAHGLRRGRSACRDGRRCRGRRLPCPCATARTAASTAG